MGLCPWLSRKENLCGRTQQKGGISPLCLCVSMRSLLVNCTSCDVWLSQSLGCSFIFRQSVSFREFHLACLVVSQFHLFFFCLPFMFLQPVTAIARVPDDCVFSPIPNTSESDLATAPVATVPSSLASSIYSYGLVYITSRHCVCGSGYCFVDQHCSIILGTISL